MRRLSLAAVAFLLFVFPAVGQTVSEGALLAVDKTGRELGACPLRQTAVKTEISGFLARVAVVQEFQNDFSAPIEAVYVFPLSQNAAVDRLTMKIGERTIRGRIMLREDARQTYEQAKADGRTAALLDQERPNIFTQSVANILPGEKVIIEISYVETLKYEDGAYEFVFPMTVGPRYQPTGLADARNISPPVALDRAGHDIAIEVDLDAGVPVEAIRSTSHEIQTLSFGPDRAKVSLKNEKTIPNKDFILRYDVTGGRIEEAVLAHGGAQGGFFTLILQPPDRFGSADLTPKEIVFVLDTSGSMSGFPIEKAKEAMMLSLNGLHPQDTFNLITFSGDTRVLFERPVLASHANIEMARQFLATRFGGGGTEMMKAIRTALEPTGSQEHVRIVCFMTDGYVGNEAEIIGEIKKYPQARVFSFGIGSSVNRYLLDEMAEAGNGEVHYVGLNDDGSAAARKFYERVRSPLLTDLSVDWNDLPVTDVYPRKIPDLFSAKPVILHGRYSRPASGTIRLRGKVAGQDYVREIAVKLPESEPRHDALAALWARTRIDELSGEAYGTDSEQPGAKIRTEIAGLGLRYNLMTHFTSFVAVEEQIRTDGGVPRKVEVPVALPEGLDRRMTGGNESESFRGLDLFARLSRPPAKNSSSGIGSGNGRSAGVPRVISGGVVNGRTNNLVIPSYPAAAGAVRASGPVHVQVTIDEQGNVTAASAVSGHPLLRAAAVQAARQTKFSPTMLSGRPVPVTGLFVYNFVDPAGSGRVSAAVGQLNAVGDGEPKPPLTPDAKAERARRQIIAEKLHFRVFAVYERWQKGQRKPAESDADFVRDGRVAVQLRLTVKTPAVIAKLQAVGFRSAGEEQVQVLVGTVPVERLAELAEIAEVQSVLPNSSEL